MKKNAFTLIELSMVLVIIALLIGGIVIGREMIKQAQLKTIMSDIEIFNKAFYSFRQKYNCWPGDCPNATQFFGTASGGCNTGSRTGTQTCNGTGDGKIGNSGNGNGFSSAHEMFSFWHHLASADLIPTQFTGYSSNNLDYQFGINAPAATKFGQNVGYGIYHLGSHSDSGYYTSNYSNLFYFGTYLANYPPINPVLTSLEAYQIDNKSDDGLPSTGNILTMKSFWNPSCTTSNADNVARYTLGSSTTACSLLIKSKF
jgi:prepilin-type N-terminal cleavage/methylation domain-containing protein